MWSEEETEFQDDFKTPPKLQQMAVKAVGKRYLLF